MPDLTWEDYEAIADIIDDIRMNQEISEAEDDPYACIFAWPELGDLPF